MRETLRDIFNQKTPPSELFELLCDEAQNIVDIGRYMVSRGRTPEDLESHQKAAFVENFMTLGIAAIGLVNRLGFDFNLLLEEKIRRESASPNDDIAEILEERNRESQAYLTKTNIQVKRFFNSVSPQGLEP